MGRVSCEKGCTAGEIAEAFGQKTEAILRQAVPCMTRKRGTDMFYICEFEFYDDGEGSVAALCLNGWSGATFGDDLQDAGESAADWLSCMVDDYLMNGRELPPVELGHEPQHGGMVIALAASRELSNIPAMTAADAARELGVSTARVTQLANAGLLDSWKEAAAWCPRLPLKHGSKALQKPEGQNPQWHNQKADSHRRVTSLATMRGFFYPRPQRLLDSWRTTEPIRCEGSRPVRRALGALLLIK